MQLRVEIGTPGPMTEQIRSPLMLHSRHLCSFSRRNQVFKPKNLKTSQLDLARNPPYHLASWRRERQRHTEKERIWVTDG